MPNDWFQFKQFTIQQKKSAMKVGTDGVLLGAWADVPFTGKILDVGTGTGVIALMMAQRSEANIFALEPEINSFTEACENAEKSSWSERIHIINKRLQDFAKTSQENFDLIISNPPFHGETIKSPDANRSLVRHSEALPMNELLHEASSMLTPEGSLALIYPYENTLLIEKLANENELFVQRKTSVFPCPGKNFHRILYQLSKKKTKTEESILMIETGIRHQYSPEYKELTQSFYSNFKY
ncbi:MAG: tRNA (adenosine(37)-N6)-methyltransferase TrmM [Bacteroidetes bacterium HGW-Bacteroidetes-21]|jgi:tRNA1Val (adenine37-N6)-methyltransferase|nr:MAG: tRNA (adenosine(37)-N6)-methyltransferase TrmM [Bacteroidetes bacterium HGW-Bacteroidetes-21]